ncbi:hypothetical protein [Gaoshiqia sp. Z1-71]|uniref:hypothetical protein n=1 Tax=Gaoshiqia hydrogeniformans TaxID=3290090 RepID=UPI003BF7CA09
MKKFAAHLIFPVSSPPISKGIVEVDRDGTISRLIAPEAGLQEMAGMEFHNGIICPAFVNLFERMELPEFFSHFPELKEFEFLIPVKRSDDRDILNWMKAIQMQSSAFTLDELIGLFTIRSARIAGLQNERGTLDEGKQPGLLLISQMDYRNLQLSDNSRLKRLI